MMRMGHRSHQLPIATAGYGNNEQGFWNWFWTDMANNLKDYPNAIFEAWNEPGESAATSTQYPAGYMTYLTTMYNAIRATGSTNLIMMQWTWAGTPTAMATTKHGQVRHQQRNPPNQHSIHNTLLLLRTNRPKLILGKRLRNTKNTSYKQAINSMGVTAPLVVNEEGSCLSSSPNKQNDYTWWQNLVLGTT